MRRASSVLVMLLCLIAASAGPTTAVDFGLDFAGSYVGASLGSVPGLPLLYGGLTFVDPSTILIGGNANTDAGRLYTIGVTRDAGNHITGFFGSAALFPGAGSTIGAFNDGGVVFGPGGVLFTSRWPVNQLGQTKPGSSSEDKIVDLAALGVAQSHAALNFVPAGFGGAGRLKLVSWAGGQWYDAGLSADGSGTFNLVGLSQVVASTVPGGPEGFVYIRAGNAGFSVNSILISEFSAGAVGAYDVDAEGNPVIASRRSFLSGLTGAEGAAIDPLTGDFLFSTFGGGNQIFRVEGFQAPSTVPEPTTLLLVSTVLAGLTVALRTRRHKER